VQDVQLELRTSIHHLKLAATLPLLADFTPKAGPSSTGRSGIKEAQVEREALEERRWALLELLGRSGQRQQPLDPAGMSSVAQETQGPPARETPTAASAEQVKVEEVEMGS